MSLRVVVIGGVALGPKAAVRLARLRPDAEITVVDQDRFISYGGCGIPYYLSEDVPDETALMSTSFHAVRDPDFFREAKGVTVLTRTRALRIDRERRVVEVEDLETGRRRDLPWDRLVVATGSVPVIPPLPGTDLGNVFTVGGLASALEIKRTVISQDIRKAVVIGGGAIGIEVTEALADIWGVSTTLVERLDHLLPLIVDAPVAGMAAHHLRERGVTVLTGEEVLRLEGNSDGRVSRVVTGARSLDADLVIMAAGVRPNSALAREAGIEVSERGGLLVNEFLQTSDPDIFAGGDCVENRSLVTGGRVYTPLGSLANRQGRVIGTNLAGGRERFDGVVGSFIVKVFDISIAAAGISRSNALREGIDTERVITVGYDRAHFMPEKAQLFLQLVVERGSRRVLGIQGAGPANDALMARIDAVAALLPHRPAVEEISNLELAYSPPFSSAMDALNALGNTAGNLLDGRYRPATADEALSLLRDESSDVLFLDLNHPRGAAPYVERYPGRWVNIPYQELRRRREEVPRDRPVLAVCDSGIRSYESQVFLAARGWTNVTVLEGGLNLLGKLGIDLLAEGA